MINNKAAFARPDSLPLGDHYADHQVIFKSKSEHGKRICFFGESAAAGYLYAPHLTPAKVLESHLYHICGNKQFELIDLAKTNETLEGLVDTVKSAMQLEPDGLVIFTGNNWTMLETPELSPYFPNVESRLQLACRLKDSGMEGVINHASRELLEKASAAFNRIAIVAHAAHIPVILVIPEVNMADWENRQAPIWLTGDKTPRWYSLLHKCGQYLQTQKWSKAEETAWQMEELDGCTCPTTYRLLAKAFLGASDERRAQFACQAEVDSNRYPTLCFLGAPQINSGGKSFQKRAADFHGFAVVDLPKVFARYTGTLLQGKRLFLDYCHLTVEGMKLSMAAVAIEVMNLFNHSNTGTSLEILMKHLPDPVIPMEADALAKFGAAIHTAHRHLPVCLENSIVKYWCQESLATSQGILPTMLDFVAARLTQMPAVLTAVQQRNFSSPFKLLMQHGWKYDYLDVAVVKAIEETTGSDVDSLVEKYFPAQKNIDLVHPPFFIWHPVERLYPEVMDVEDFIAGLYRAVWPESNFVAIARSGRVVKLELTLRLPGIVGWAGKRKGRVVIKWNGKPIGSLHVGEQWRKATLSIKIPVQRQTIHQITLCWPALPPCGSEAINGAINRLEQGMLADLHPVFGEVFSLIVK